MKKYIILFMSLSLLISCYKDKGNYDYKPTINIKVSGIEQKYELEAFKDILEINPKIVPENLDYKYYWIVYPEGSSDISAFDTISMQKDLKQELTLSPGGYNLRFCAEDTKTGIFSYTEHKLSVRTEQVKGWWVLKADDGYTDIDIHTSTTVFPNRIRRTNKNIGLLGHPIRLILHNDWLRPIYNNEGKNLKFVSTKSVFVASDKDIKVLDYYTNKIIGNFENLFFDGYAPTKKPNDLFLANRDVILINDDKLHYIKSVGMSKTGFFSNPIEGDYKISSHKATNFLWYPLLFNEKKSAFSTFSSSDIDLREYRNNPLKDVELLFLGHKKFINPAEYAYAVMKSKVSNEKYFIKLRSNNRSTSKSPILKIDTLPTSLKINNADGYTTAKDYNQIFFRVGNTIWSYDADNIIEKEQIKIPINEKITYMENLITSVPKQEHSYMVVATESSSRYKVYIYDIQAGNIKPIPVKILSGDGLAKKVSYMELNNNHVYQTYGE